MSKTLVILLALAFVGHSLAQPADLLDWNQYKIKYGKVYERSLEDDRRFSHFLASKERIEKHNAANRSYTLGLNQFSDWSPEEFGRLIRAKPMMATAEYSTPTPTLNADKTGDRSTKEIDLRKHPNRVTSVKDQGKCLSDWAFSAAGALEGQVIVRTETKQLESLSAQNFIDCVRWGNARGCEGGSVSDAFSGIFYEGGVNTEKDYPYVGTEQECQSKSNKVINDRGFDAITASSETELQSYVESWGPVAVRLGAIGWRDYQSGIFDAACSFNEGYVYALIVGYGSDPKDGDFWIVKNSWSEKWGEAGYMRLRRGKRTCGIGNEIILANF